MKITVFTNWGRRDYEADYARVLNEKDRSNVLSIVKDGHIVAQHQDWTAFEREDVESTNFIMP